MHEKGTDLTTIRNAAEVFLAVARMALDKSRRDSKENYLMILGRLEGDVEALAREVRRFVDRELRS